MSMEDLLSLLERIGPVFVDAFCVVDREGRIIEFNRHFSSLFPRSVARKLRGTECCQFLKLGICETGGCLADQCLESQAAVRFDEILATVEGLEGERCFIVSAVPLAVSDEDEPEGVLIVLRDVSDLADVQRKYRASTEVEGRDHDKLEDELHRKVRELLETNTELNRVQTELSAFKKGILG